VLQGSRCGSRLVAVVFVWRRVVVVFARCSCYLRAVSHGGLRVELRGRSVVWWSSLCGVAWCASLRGIAQASSSHGVAQVSSSCGVTWLLSSHGVAWLSSSRGVVWRRLRVAQGLSSHGRRLHVPSHGCCLRVAIVDGALSSASLWSLSLPSR
jgi:hypothetical protein